MAEHHLQAFRGNLRPLNHLLDPERTRRVLDHALEVTNGDLDISSGIPQIMSKIAEQRELIAGTKDIIRNPQHAPSEDLEVIINGRAKIAKIVWEVRKSR